MLSGPGTILMSADPVGGVWTYCLELARSPGWREMGLCLATMGAALSPAQAAEAARLPNVHVAESEYKLEWMDEPWMDVERAGEWLLELEESFHPDIVHLNGYAHGALAFHAPKVIVAHSCVLSWWKAVKGEPAPSRWNCYREAVRNGLDHADAIIAPSRAMLDNLVRFYGPIKNGRVIFNGCEPRAFTPGCKEPFIFAAGRIWDEAKNIHSLGLIAPKLEWSVYVAGENRHPGGQSAADPEAALHCLGKLSRPELADWYGRASIYVLPARYEPFGQSILEAALSGCALVLGDIPSLRELWSDAALFVPADDPDELTFTLQHLIANSTERKLLAARAASRARRYSVDSMCESYLELYRSLLPKPKLLSEEFVPCA
jgi:glycogen synthase